MSGPGDHEPKIELGEDPRSRPQRGAAISSRSVPMTRSPKVAPTESFLDRIKFYLGLAIVAAVLLGGIGALFGPKIVRRLSAHGRAAARIEPHVQGLAQYDRQMPATDQHYVVGKVVVIDEIRREVDPVFYELPEELYAKDANEIGTLVIVACGTTILGEYRSRGSEVGVFKAYASNCTVEVVDRGGRVRSFHSVASKEAPPLVQGSLDGHWYAPRPTRDIAAWIVGLPRR